MDDATEKRLTFRIEATDHSGAVWNAVTQHLKNTRSALRQFAQESGQTAGAVKALAGSVTGLLGGAVRGVFGVFQSILSSVLGLLGRLIGSVTSLAQTIGGALWGAVTRVFGYIGTTAKAGVLGLVTAMGLLARQGVAVNVSLETTQRGLATLLHSSREAGSLMRALRKEATTSAFEFVDLADMSKRLLAFGFAARDIIPIIRTLGDVTSGMGSGKEGLDRLINAIGQIKAKGVLQGDEAMQLTEAGINVRQILGIKPGQDIGRLAIPSDRAIPRLIGGLQQQFGGMQAGAVTELPGIYSNIKDVINEIGSSVTVGLHESLKRAGYYLQNFLNSLEKTKSGRIILGTLKSAFDAVGRAIEGLTGKIPAAANWLAKLLSGEKFQTFKVAATNAFEAAKNIVGNVVAWIGANWEGIWTAVVAKARTAGGIIAGIWGGLRSVWQNSGKSLSDAFSNGLNAAREFAASVITAMGPVIGVFARVGEVVVRTITFLKWNFARGYAEQADILRQGHAQWEALNRARQWGETGAFRTAEWIRASLDPSRMKGFNTALTQQGAIGDFARGFAESRGAFETWWDGLGGNHQRTAKPRSGSILPEVPTPELPTGSAPGSVSGTVPSTTGSVPGALGAQGTGGEGKKSPLETIRDIRQSVLGSIDKRIEAFRAWMDASPENTHSRITRNYLLPLMQKRMRLLSTYTGPIGSDNWWDDVSEFQRTRSQYNELQESLKPKAPEASETPATTKPGVRRPKMARVLGGWMAVPGSEEVVTAPASASGSGGTTLIFNIPTTDPETIGRIVAEKLYALKQQAYAG